ncbi:MAG: hypothetical protein IJ222_00835 [Bacteroidales bacterium]|nr:hypothetical protein [Bacteroidales bacterium]
MNNILSTDSISPAALYPLRKTGNKRFFSVPACPSDEAIFLYSRIPSYKVAEGSMENYRIVIALDTDNIGLQIKKISSKHKVDTYVCDSTIFFTPLNASFLYEGKNAYQTCLIQAEQSLENKTFNLYGHKQIDHALEFKWDKSYCDKTGCRLQASTVIGDERIDRIKGAILCYFAGLNQVKSPELAVLKKDARKIKNIFSAIVNSPNKGLSQEQESILEPVIKEFYEVFPSVDPVSIKNKEALDFYLASSKTLRANEGIILRTTILSIIEELGLSQSLMQRAGAKEPFNVYTLYDIIGNNRIADIMPVKMAEMDKAIADVERSLSSSSVSQSNLHDVFHLSDSHELVISDNEVKLDFYNKFLNALIDGKHLDNTDQKPSLSIALLGGQILKSLFDEEKWNTSSFRAYTNALLSNIQNGTPFDVLSDSHDILQAFAVFSLKGADIDKLSDNLSQNGISEYKYAWGLYGAAYGYSQLPKTFTNSILRKELLVDIFSVIFPEQGQLQVEETQKSYGDQVMNIEPSLGKELLSETSYATQIDTNVPNEAGTHEKYTKDLDPYEELRSKLESVRYGKKAKSLTSTQVKQILDLYSHGQHLDEAFIAQISRIRGIGDESLKALRDTLQIYPIHTSDSNLFSEEYYAHESELFFAADKGLFDIVNELRIGDPDVERIIIDAIKRVQDNHIKDVPKDNNECIKHLKNLIFYDKAPKHLKRTPNNEQIVEALIDTLKTRYR